MGAVLSGGESQRRPLKSVSGRTKKVSFERPVEAFQLRKAIGFEWAQRQIIGFPVCCGHEQSGFFGPTEIAA
jgi:hypothetical protein